MSSTIKVTLAPIILVFILFVFGYNSGLTIFQSDNNYKKLDCTGLIFCKFEKINNNVSALVDDDVMITLGVAKRFLANQNTRFNDGDSAQAATSYILPILSSPLFFMPDLYAVLIFSFFGFLSIYLCWLIIVKGSDLKTKSNLILVVFLNTTISSYMLTGWEHVHQALLILLAWYFTLYKDGIRYYLIIGMLSALAILMRIDSIFIIGALYLYIFTSNNKNKIIYTCLSGLAVGLFYLYFQLSWFDYITPTTARLKTGFSIDIFYNIKYVLTMLISGSCFIYILYFIFSLLNKTKLKKETYFILSGVIINLIYAFLVSDAFQYGRMYLASFIILTFAFIKIERLNVNTNIIILTVILSFSNAGYELLKERVRTPAITATESQYILSREIKNLFNPDDGAIGLFYLGTISFALPNFQIADFLGKADEEIAQLEAIKGQPIGHNKFDPGKTIEKWNVAVVPFDVSTANSDIEKSIKAIENQSIYFFWHLAKMELISRGYVFCQPNKELDWGFYVRSDLLEKIDKCNS
jgi:hypothetical protein